MKMICSAEAETIFCEFLHFFLIQKFHQKIEFKQTDPVTIFHEIFSIFLFARQRKTKANVFTIEKSFPELEILNFMLFVIKMVKVFHHQT